jgi:diacylglycerol kinase (ATP)
MAREKIAFIINPNAGRRRSKNLVTSISRYLDMERYDPVFRFTKYAGHAPKLASRLLDDGYGRIVAVGGDGTVNEVASSLVERKASLGIIPTGSGNGLARYLNIPVRLAQAVKVLNHGSTFSIDAGKLNKHWFFCTCGVGFDARIGHKFAKSNKRGLRSYVRTIIREFRKYRPGKYKFTVDGEKFSRRAFLITIANAGQYGNNAYIAPSARIDDGWFDICIVKPFPLFKTLSLGLRLFNKSIERTPYVEVNRGKEIIFRKPKKKYVFHYDGEPVKFKNTKIKISMHHNCLEVLVNSRIANR